MLASVQITPTSRECRLVMTRASSTLRWLLLRYKLLTRWLQIYENTSQPRSGTLKRVVCYFEEGGVVL